MLVNTGLNEIRNFLNDESPTPPSHMAVGTGTTPVSPYNTALGAEVLRKAITKDTMTTAGVIEYSMELLSTEANGNALTEVGILNAASGGTLYLRKKHLAFSKTSEFGVKYRIRHTIENR